MARPKVRNEEVRGRLLTSAMELLASGGSAAVTTRAVASGAGTSGPALAELFGGKEGLVRAMFAEGFDALARDLAELGTSGDGTSDVFELVWAFRRFALRQPRLFEVMFSRPFAEFRPSGADLAAAARIHQLVMDRVSAALGPSVPAAVRKDAAIGLFAVVQGLASLELAGVLGSGPTSIERRWSATVSATLAGLQTRGTSANSDQRVPGRT